jgi:hypothetical protein
MEEYPGWPLERSGGLVRSTGSGPDNLPLDSDYSSLFKNLSIVGTRLNLDRTETATYMSAASRTI